MKKIAEDILKDAIDLNVTVIFEYNISNDTISFSDNVGKYIPIAVNLSNFVKNIDTVGKINEEDCEKAISFFTSEKHGDKIYMEYVRFLDFAGNYRWYHLKGKMAISTNSSEKTFYGTMTYINDDRKAFDEERALLRTDITGLITKEPFFDSIDSYIKEKTSDVIPVLLVVEIDEYDAFVKKYGEISGDGVQIEVSRVLKKAFRKSDLIAQISEKEFGVFMKGVHSAPIVLERSKYVTQSVKDFYEQFEDARKVTVSIGASIIRESDVNSDKLYELGKAALDNAKSEGPGNYVLLDGEKNKIDASGNPILSTKEMELVRNILDPVSTWAYAIDDKYQLIYKNALLEERLGPTCGGLCYKEIKNYDAPCEDCPIKKFTDKSDSADAVVYSPFLRNAVPTRATKITMRNGRDVYVVAAVNENIEEQIELLREAEGRLSDALVGVQSIIWDINLTKNTCIRIKESGINSVMDLRVKDYRRLVDDFTNNVVHPSDIGDFLTLVDAGSLKRAKEYGKEFDIREVRLKNLEGDYDWFTFYTVFPKRKSNKKDIKGNEGAIVQNDQRVMLVAFNVNESKKASLDAMEAKVKREIMREKSNISMEMALNYERHENVNDMIGLLVYEYTVATDSFYLNSSFDDIFNIDRKNLSGAWAIINALECHESEQVLFEKFIKMVKVSNLAQRVTVRLKNKFGKYTWYTVTIQALRGLNNEPVRYLGTFQNVDSEMKIKMEMEYRADYDSISGVYNSEAFYRRVMEMINVYTDTKFAIFSVDIDKFRLINDTYGIEAGNQLLKTIGVVLKSLQKEHGCAKRYQADVFSVLVPYNNDQELVEYMSEITTEINKNNQLHIPVSLTFGIYKVIDRFLPVRIMCDRARAAKRQLKGSSSASNYAVYDDKIRLKMREQAEIEEQMELALANHEYVMFLQPQIDVATGKMCGAEALVRWNHPTKGIMVPFQFLELFESNGFIIKLDKYMWKEACKYLADLKKRGIDVPISVNISRAHIGATDLVKEFTSLVEEYGISPSQLDLEITENVFMDDVHELFEQMSALKQHGFKIHMDDFGSAYSSLNMLRNAPVDALKIDKYFFDEIMTTERGKIIVESSVRMAKQLGLVTIAEGIERIEQLEFLRIIGCDIVQGYYFSRPISIDDFEVFMEENL